MYESKEDKKNKSAEEFVNYLEFLKCWSFVVLSITLITRIPFLLVDITHLYHLFNIQSRWDLFCVYQ